MKLTDTLFAHNVRRWTNWKWLKYSKRKVYNTNMKEALEAKNIPVYDAMEVVAEKPVLWQKHVETRGLGALPPKLDEQHALWNEKPCFFYRDHNLLVKGLSQAKLFTNTVEMENGLPEEIQLKCDQLDTEQYENLIQMALASAVVFDATQKKLPIKRDSEWPAWKYARDYGITDTRKNYILCNRFLHLAELIAGLEVSKHRCKFQDAFFSVPLLRDDINQLEMRADLLLLADKSLNVQEQDYLRSTSINTSLPNLEPLKYNISLEEEHFYKLQNIYPVRANTIFKYAHTAFIHFNETEVKNLYGTPVLEDQTIARSLMKCFTIAAAEARFLYGENIQDLPTPLCVQCVQTDAKYFHFSVFQLNTLRWPPDTDTCKWPPPPRNLFWHNSIMAAYEFGGYFEGQPTISAYNPHVFKTLLAFYLNK